MDTSNEIPEQATRYGQVTRRAFLGGLSVTAIATTAAACSSSSSSTVSSAASSAASAATSAASSAASATSSAGGSASSAASAAAGAALPTSAAAKVDWTFGGSGMKNPYMAVWIEDANGGFVKTLALYHKASGDNWLNTLTRWVQVSGATDTTTSGTVPAGSFSATWDGSTAAGGRASAGSYYVCVESVVEHGSESLVRQAVTFGTAAAKTTLTAAGDITAASVTYTV